MALGGQDGFWNATTHLSITYIREPVIPKSNCSDPLVWWATMSPYSSPSTRNNVNNKVLIQMAQDFLSGPPGTFEGTHWTPVRPRYLCTPVYPQVWIRGWAHPWEPNTCGYRSGFWRAENPQVCHGYLTRDTRAEL
ncbi:hypothetical protein GGX14DRAFT_384051 [Mycena pura]|uniref:Uncharacterized protein n=1 Tax=Mycena pura TaxID=153505 RepID=A0AAD6YV31_9AGAR|nr:hypothetical protein GGX14DRAFT_384051 [Mycena pura]